MITTANRIFVAPEFAEQFENNFRNRARMVDGMPGFVSNQLLRPVNAPGRFPKRRSAAPTSSNCTRLSWTRLGLTWKRNLTARRFRFTNSRDCSRSGQLAEPLCRALPKILNIAVRHGHLWHPYTTQT
jgi:hypothetical protein